MTVSKTTFFVAMNALAEVFGRKLSEPTLAFLHQTLPSGLTDEAFNLAVMKFLDSDEQFFPTPGKLLKIICEDETYQYIDSQGRTEFGKTGRLKLKRSVAEQLNLKSHSLYELPGDAKTGNQERLLDAGAARSTDNFLGF